MIEACPEQEGFNVIISEGRKKGRERSFAKSLAGVYLAKLGKPQYLPLMMFALPS
jgi:hypothetical protein